LGTKLGETDFVQFDMKDVAIEEKDGSQCLILGGGGNFFDRCEVGEELVDFGRAHFFGVAFVMEEDVFLCPVDVGVASARGIVFEVDGLALVEEFFLFPWRGRLGQVWLCHFKAFFEVAGL